MSHDARPALSRPPTTSGDSAVEPVHPGHRRATGGEAKKRVWLVHHQGHEERIEADDVEITASGVLVFYRFASRMDQERTLLTAISPGLGWRCQLESEC
jgi:hypothetical protein